MNIMLISGTERKHRRVRRAKRIGRGAAQSAMKFLLEGRGDTLVGRLEPIGI